MTSEVPWDPSTVSVKLLRNLIIFKTPSRLISKNECDHLLESCLAIYTEKTMLQRMVPKVRVPRFDGRIDQEVEGTGDLRISEVISKERIERYHTPSST